MAFQARIALFDNSAAVAENDQCPVMTGKLEIPADQVAALAAELEKQEEQSYGDRRFKVIDLSVWENAGGNTLLYSGKARMPQAKKPVTLDSLMEQQRKLQEAIAQMTEAGEAAEAPEPFSEPVDNPDEAF